MEPATWTVILQIIGFGLKWFGARQDTLAAFEKLVVDSKDQGLISVDTKNVFLAQKAELMKTVPPSA